MTTGPPSSAPGSARIEGSGDREPIPVPTFADGLVRVFVLDAIRASASGGGALVACDTRPG